MNLEFGDIYLVRFHPSVGSELKRYRPAVVISGVVNKIDKRFTLIAPLSTNKENLENEFELLVKNESLETTSALLLWYLRTVDTTRLERKLGRLSKKDVASAKKLVKTVFK